MEADWNVEIDGVDTEGEDECSMRRLEGTGRRVRFLSANDAMAEEELTEMQDKQLLKYWGRGARRYSEAEQAFLNRVRLPDTENREKRKKPAWFSYCDPGSYRLHLWLMVVSAAVLYNSWTLTLRTAFKEVNNAGLYLWMGADYLCDLIYIMDIFISMRTGYLEDGILQTDGRKLRKHYFYTVSFILDALSILPLDFVYFFIEYEPAVRMNRLLKYYRFWHFLDRTENRTTHPNLFRLASLIQFILVIIHWNACIYFIVSRYIGFGTDRWVYPGIKGMTSLNNTYSSLARKYVYSFYWSTQTLTTIGEIPSPYSNLEYIIVTLNYLTGVLLFATIVGNVGSIVTNVNTAKVDFQNRMDGIKSYMRFHKIPRHLQQRVIKWFDYLWTSKKHPDEEAILHSLPDKLRAEIAIHVHLDSLRKVEIFQDCEAGFLCELVLRLRAQLFSPGDFVCRKGEVGREMYIVNRGKLEVVSENGQKVYAVLEVGSYFGEISVLCVSNAGNRRTASVRSVGYSDLFCLSKDDLTEVLNEYPELKEKIENIAKQKLENDRRRKSFIRHDSKPRTNSAQNSASGGSEQEKMAEKIEELRKELTRVKDEYNSRLANLEGAIVELLREKNIEISSKPF